MRERVRVVVVARMHKAFREIAVLWLVFAIVDRLVASSLTIAWVCVNVAIAVAFWICGIYIESTESKEG